MKKNQFASQSCQNTSAKYCLSLLRGGKKCEVDISLALEVRLQIEEWYGRCEVLFEEARRLASCGEEKGGLAFDDLKRRSLKLADEYLSGPDRGSVFSKVAQIFDNKAKGVRHGAFESACKIDGVWITYPQLSKDEYKVLEEVQKLASWNPPCPEDLQKARARFIEAYPDNQHLLAAAESNGRLFLQIKECAFQLGASRGIWEDVAGVLSRANIPCYLHKRIQEAFEKGRSASLRGQEAKKLTKSLKRSAKGKRNGQVGSAPNKRESVPPLKPVNTRTSVAMADNDITANSILNLKPSNRWTIVADETGSAFGNNAFDSKKDSGRYVFVLIPEYANLSSLTPGWHAVDQKLPVILSAAEELSKSGCGIIGIPVRGLYRTNRELWFSCIETLLDITLRLLPVEGETEIRLNVEQRGNANADNSDMIDKTLDDTMYHLSLVNPEKAKNIKLSAAFITKRGNPYNGYADLVAYSWGCSKSMRQVFDKFGWVGPCLISDSPEVVQAFRRCLELIHHGGALPEDDWNVLVQSRVTMSVGSLIGALLYVFGVEASKDVKVWRLYLDYVLSHLDSKAIRMSVLVPQIAWLKEYEPDAAQLPPRLRLLWLTAQLAESNHLGGTKFGAELHEREFVELCERLKDEDAPLTCFAALHLAVEKTDSYEFEVARSILKSWERERVAVPGLRYHAQVLSSLGQHAAFLGDNEKALEYFLKAMDEFRLLSADWQRDFDQTCAYAVIAAMDAKSSDFERLMSLYLYGGEWSEETMVDMAHQFAAVGEDEPDSKYAHAILLRYLMTLPADNPIRSTYLADSAKWQWSEDGHPWELIAFYRALLLSQDDPARRECLRKGYNLCANGGPTLKAIAAVILGALLYDGAATRDEYVAKVEEVINLLPNLGKVRASALLAHADKPIPPLELAAKVLPFNFR